MVPELTTDRGDVQMNTTRVGFFLILAILHGRDLGWVLVVRFSYHQMLSGSDILWLKVIGSSVGGKPQKVREFSYTAIHQDLGQWGSRKSGRATSGVWK